MIAITRLSETERRAIIPARFLPLSARSTRHVIFIPTYPLSVSTPVRSLIHPFSAGSGILLECVQVRSRRWTRVNAASCSEMHSWKERIERTSAALRTSKRSSLLTDVRRHEPSWGGHRQMRIKLEFGLTESATKSRLILSDD